MNRHPPVGNIQIKQARDKASADDGQRILIDRTWPRGLDKKSALIDDWIKDVAPSAKLEKWFNCDATRWDEFCDRFAHEIHRQRLDELRALAEKGRITLVYGAKDPIHNAAAALRNFILQADAALSPLKTDPMASKQNGTHEASAQGLTEVARRDVDDGAGPDGVHDQSHRTAVSHEVSQPTNWELAHLRVRVIALENLVITLLAEASDRQLNLAREMAEFILPNPGATPHPLAIHASAHMLGLVNRARHFRVQTPG
jgi:uncharacterized protein YeaO (DUF488 family)